MFGFIKEIFIRLSTSIVKASNHTKFESYIIRNERLSLLVLIYILMNALKDSVTIHL